MPKTPCPQTQHHELWRTADHKVDGHYCFTCKDTDEVEAGQAWYECSCDMRRKENRHGCKHYIPNMCMPYWLCETCAAEPGWVKRKSGFGTGTNKDGTIRDCENCTPYLY